eukprot:468468_1
MPRKGKRGNNWKKTKKRSTTCTDRIPKKDRRKISVDKFYQKNKHKQKQLKISISPKVTPSEFGIRLQTKVHDKVTTFHKHSSVLKATIDTQSKRIIQLEKRSKRDKRTINVLKNELSESIFNEYISDTDNKDDMDFVMPTISPTKPTISKPKKTKLTVSSSQNIQYMGNINTLDPKFVEAYKAFVNLRLYLRVLKNNKVLPEMLNIINTANKLLNGSTKPIDLGSTSNSTLSRLQQFRGLDLVTIETCIMYRFFWDPNDSVLTVYHDGTSQNNESQESVLTAFNIEEFGEYEKLMDHEFTPETRENCIFRGIWHQNIPKTDAETTIEWAIIPAFNRLDHIGYGLFGTGWIPMKQRVKKKIGTMTDAASTAQSTSRKIGSIYNSELIFKNICLQHNYGNNLTPGVQRLKATRIHFVLKDKKEQDVVKRTIKMTIFEICLNIQKVLVQGIDNTRAKGGLFQFLLGHAKSVAFGREIGDRKQHQFKCVEAAISVRDVLGKMSLMADKKSKPVLYNARVLYEFSESRILLREALIVVNLGRNYSTPSLLKTSKYDPMMNKCIPFVREMLDSLDSLFQVGFSSAKMLGLVLGLLSLSKEISPNILVNKFELQSNLEIICDIGGVVNDINQHGKVNISLFYDKIQEMISNTVFVDKYYFYLFDSTKLEFESTLEELYGVYRVTFEDMTNRFNEQCMTPPKSMLGNNDPTESMQGSSKYYQKYKLRIAEFSRAVRTLHDVNKIWYTFDWLMKHDFEFFVDVLMFWFYDCGSYRLKAEEKKLRLNEYNQIQQKQYEETISNSIQITPKVPQHLNLKTKQLKPPVSLDFEFIKHPAWHRWCIERNKTICHVIGLGVMLTREKLQTKILKIINDKQLMKYPLKIKTTWKVRKLQKELYEHCKKIAFQSNHCK